MFKVRDTIENYIYTVYAVDAGNGMISSLAFLIWTGEQWSWVRATRYVLLEDGANG